MSTSSHDILKVDQKPSEAKPELSSSRGLILADLGRILFVYTAWKLFLLQAIASSPGIGYDTSTDIYFDRDGPAPTHGVNNALRQLAIRLTRWDGIYFTSNSYDGYVYEQQWAFSWVMAKTIALLSNVVPLPRSLSPIATHALTGCVISMTTHLAAVVSLYFLVIAILPSTLERSRCIALAAAHLHTLSVAGVFLIAPYGEASFAMLNIAGMLAYAHATQQRARNHHALESILMLIAGGLFGAATTVRNNGILSGIIFAWDALDPALNLVFGARTLTSLGKLIITSLAGLLVAAGFVLPQFVAYYEYCIDGALDRPWCSRRLPSIYTWVQEHYWEVGLFKYWTFSNLPLFVLAAPVLLLLVSTGYAALHHARSILIAVNGEERPALMKSTTYQAQRLAYTHILERLALPQIVLAILAALSFHVQIINRISSGYPMWYVVLAIAVQDGSPGLECGHTRSEHYYPFRWLRDKLLKRIVQGLIIYAVVQAGLYACFLPPA